MTTYHDEGQMQLSHMTKINRFPKMMTSAKLLKPKARRILSFGCSTGEEAQTLAEIFPQATIVGVDTDYYSVSTARKNNKYKNRVFFHTDVGATGRYDIVTCFMVLFSLETSIPRDKWEEVCKIIDDTVAANGLLMIYTSDYDFKTSSVGEKYKALKEWKRTHNRNKKKYFCGYYKKQSKLVDQARLYVS